MNKFVRYAIVAFAVGALTQGAQLAIAASLAPIESPGRWAVAGVAGIVAAGIVKALPWLEKMLPAEAPPPENPV